MNSFPEWFKIIMRLVAGFTGLGLVMFIVGGLALFLFSWLPAQLGWANYAVCWVMLVLTPVAYGLGSEWIG